MYDKKFWNDRYSDPEYLYGTDANQFLIENVHRLRGPVLSLSEGEGRNAVFMASHGLSVLGVDCADVALAKARALAESRGVTIETEVADLADYVPEENHFGAAVSIFGHLPSTIRRRLFPLVEKALQPGGVFLLEAYSEEQLEKTTGGPKDLDMLMSLEKLREELPGLKPVLARELEREVREGGGHTGMASVVQLIGIKET